VDQADITKLHEQAAVEFSVEQTAKGPQAENIKLLKE